MPSIKVYRFGEWTRARNRFNGLAFRMQQAVESAQEQEARGMARRIKHNIRAQNYQHTDLADETVERKAREGKDPRILIEDGDYVEAIEPIRLGRYQWAVGVRDPKLAEIGNVHEWGGHGPQGQTIPERPHYRVELERIRGLTPGRRLPTIAAALARVLAGQRPVFNPEDEE